MAHVLLIDDDLTLIPAQVRQLFPAPDHRVEVAGTGVAGLEQVRAEPPDVILLDLRLPDQSGLEVYQQIRRIDARIPVIFITTGKMADAAIEAMKQGAYDYLFKPLDLQQLQRVVGEALDVVRTMRAPAVVVETPSEDDVVGAIIGCCPAMREVYKAIGRVAAQNVPVLITGESGTGKELVARAIYQHGPRARAPFLALNCAAIPENLLESELFGHEKSAFTGADRRRIGKFEQCNGGTILLDEIGDMPLSLQAKMLRLLQEQAFERLGGNEMRADRCAPDRGDPSRLESMVGGGEVPAGPLLPPECLHHPPAALAGADRRPAACWCSTFCRRFSRDLGREVREVAPEALERLRRYTWPGNIRELQSVLKQALLNASGPTLLPAFLPAFRTEPYGPETASQSAAEDPGLEIFIRLLPRLGYQRPVCGNAPPSGPPLANPCPGGHGWESTSGRPPAGDCSRHPAPKTPRAGTALHPPAGSRRRRPALAPFLQRASGRIRASGWTDTAVGRFVGNCIKSRHLKDSPIFGAAPGCFAALGMPLPSLSDFPAQTPKQRTPCAVFSLPCGREPLRVELVGTVIALLESITQRKLASPAHPVPRGPQSCPTREAPFLQEKRRWLNPEVS